MAVEEKKDLYDFIIKLSTTSTPSKEISDQEFLYHFEEFITKLSPILTQATVNMDPEHLRFIQIIKHFMKRAVDVPELDVFARLDKEIAFYIEFNTINKSEENMVPIWRVLFNYTMTISQKIDLDHNFAQTFAYIPNYTLNCIKSLKHFDIRFIQIVLQYYLNNIFLLFNKRHFNSIESVIMLKEHNQASFKIIRKLLVVIKMIFRKGYYDPEPLHEFSGIIFGKRENNTDIEKLVLKQVTGIVMSLILNCTGRHQRDEAQISYKSRIFELLLEFLFKTFVGIQILGLNLEGSCVARILCSFMNYREYKMREVFIDRLSSIYNKTLIYMFTSTINKKIFLSYTISLKELLHSNIIENLVFIITNHVSNTDSDIGMRDKVKSIYKSLYIYTASLLPESYIYYFHENNISFKCHTKNLVVYRTEMKKLRLCLQKLTYAFPFNTPPTLSYYLARKLSDEGLTADESNYYAIIHKNERNDSIDGSLDSNLLSLKDNKIKNIECDFVKINTLCIYIQSIRKQAIFWSEGGLVMDMQTSASMLSMKNQPWNLDFNSGTDINKLNDFLEEVRLSANYLFCDNRDFKRFFKRTIESFSEDIKGTDFAWTVLFKKQILFIKKLVSILTINPGNNVDGVIAQIKKFLLLLMAKEIEIIQNKDAPVMNNSIELIQFFGNSMFVKNKKWDILKNPMFLEHLSKPKLTYNEQITIFYIFRSYTFNSYENLLFHLTLFVEKINFQVCRDVYYFLKTTLKKSYLDEKRKSDIRSIFINTLEKNKLLDKHQRAFLVKHVFLDDSVENVKEVRRKSIAMAPDLNKSNIKNLETMNKNVKEFIVYLENNLEFLLEHFKMERDYIFDRDFNTIERYIKSTKNIYGDKYCPNISHYITPFEKSFYFPYFLLKCHVIFKLSKEVSLELPEPSYFYKINIKENTIILKDCLLVYSKKEIIREKLLPPFFQKNAVVEHVYEINDEARKMIMELGLCRLDIESVRIEIAPAIEPAGKYILISNINYRMSQAYYEKGITIFGNSVMFFDQENLSDMCIIVKKSPFVVYDHSFQFNLNYYSEKEEMVVVTTVINVLKKMSRGTSLEKMLRFYHLGCTILDSYREYFHREFYKLVPIKNFYEMFLAEHLSFNTCTEEALGLLEYFSSLSIEEDRQIDLGENFSDEDSTESDTGCGRILVETNNIVLYSDSLGKIKDYLRKAKKENKKDIVKAITECFYTNENHNKQKRYLMRWLASF